MLAINRTQNNRLDAMIRSTLASGLDTSGAGCPEPDLLAAFAENTLAAPDSRAKLNTHVAGCALCQRQLATLARADALDAKRGSIARVLHHLVTEVVDADQAREEAWRILALGPQRDIIRNRPVPALTSRFTWFCCCSS